jgi:hypothetical protein
VTKLVIVADEGCVSVFDIAECVANGFEVYAAGAEFDVCIPCDKEQVEEEGSVVSYEWSLCVCC